jgi:hypothetical protein
MSKRNNQEVTIIYNKDNKSLFISFTQSKKVEHDKVDDNIAVWKDDKRGWLQLEIRDFDKYIKQHTTRYGFNTNKQNSTVTGITTPIY